MVASIWEGRGMGVTDNRFEISLLTDENVLELVRGHCVTL